MPKDSEKNAPSDEMSYSELLALGKRNMACQNIHNAILCYARACSKIAKEHGPLCAELAEPSYLYGRALLEAARLEPSVLGDSIPVDNNGQPSSSSEDEDEGPDQSDQSAVKETSVNEGSSNDQGGNSSGVDQHDVEASESKSPDQDTSAHDQESSSHGQEDSSHDQEDSSHDQAGSSHDQAGSSHDQAGSSHDQGNSSNVQEDITGLQLAWEVLELSRVILSKQDTREAKLRQADIMSLLGEIGLESDMFEQAIKDFTASLDIRQSLLPDYDRSIAELHFQLGLSYMLIKDYDNSIQAYQKAKNTLTGTMEHLDSLIADENTTDKEGYQKELRDIKELMPDLDSKIEDAKDANRQMANIIRSFMQQDGAGPSSAFDSPCTAAVSKAPATDISHLVRKRPRDNAQPEDDAKRSKQDEPAVTATTIES